MMLFQLAAGASIPANVVQPTAATSAWAPQPEQNHQAASQQQPPNQQVLYRIMTGCVYVLLDWVSHYALQRCM